MKQYVLIGCTYIYVSLKLGRVEIRVWSVPHRPASRLARKMQDGLVNLAQGVQTHFTNSSHIRGNLQACGSACIRKIIIFFKKLKFH